jgi:hypothetical protein
MQASLKLTGGSAPAPALNFNGNINTGFYLSGAGDMRASVSGTDKMRWLTTGVEVFVGGVWYPLLSNNVSTEFVELIAGQTVVTFIDDVEGSSFYVSGPNADDGEIFEYTYEPVMQQLTLNESYPAGTRIYAKLFAAFG